MPNSVRLNILVFTIILKAEDFQFLYIGVAEVLRPSVWEVLIG